MTREAYLQNYRIRFLVTGGAGFIGSHLCELLLRNEHFVVALDNLETGSIRNIEHLLTHPNFIFVEDSVLNEKVLAKYVGMCDIVMHLAAAVGVKYILDHPIESLSVNIAGTEMLLAQAAHFRKRVFVASTSEVYGKQSGDTLKEGDDLHLGPTSIFRWSYACSKALDEFMALAQHRTNRLPVVVGRLFNTVGPRQVGTYGMVIPRFVERALAGDPILVYGDGNQSRTFTHVRDAVEIIYRLIMCPAAYGGVFNIGGTDTITINDLARRVIEKTRSTSTIQYIPYDQVYGPDFQDMERRIPNLAKLRAVIGEFPAHGIDAILDDVVEEKRAVLAAAEGVARSPVSAKKAVPSLRAPAAEARQLARDLEMAAR